jgi:hypothetical protein
MAAGFEVDSMLIDVALKALKGEAKPYKRADGGGLLILIQPDGREY